MTRTYAGLCASALALLASTGHAQTRFLWPDDTAAISRYETPEECLAAAHRVQARLSQWGPVWEDTLTFTLERATAPLPTAVQATARQCSARFKAETAPVTDFAPLLALYLAAGRDADAATIVRRRLAVVAATAPRERAAVLDSALLGYLTTPFGNAIVSPHPARVAAAESLLVVLSHLPDTLLSLKDRVMPVFVLMRAAQNTGDTTAVRRVGQGLLDRMAWLSNADRRSEYYEQLGSILAYFAMNMVHDRTLLDSLRHGTTGYIALKRSYWARASGERPEALHFPIGEIAPAVHADTWFRNGDTSMARPSTGQLALVVFLDYACREPNWDACSGTYPALRRLAARYPNLQITVAASTHGFYTNLAPPTLPQEAEVLRHWWQDYHRLPGALGVSFTPFWRLDAPDSRRVDQAVANTTSYSFGRSWEVGPGSAFLVDRHGVIVEVGKLGSHESFGVPDFEAHLAQLVDVLLARPESAS
jgi:hypothetical protein